jgi:dimethylglycine dehydrogenase
VLIERKELTSGSTWHAAGLLPLFNLSYSVGQIHKYSVALYQTLEQETGLDVGFRQVSNIRLARTRDRMDEYHYYAGVAATIGVKVKFLTPSEVKDIWPLCDVEGIIGAIQHPEDGYVQPADLTQALARGARERGGEINRQTTVTALARMPSGEWKVSTDKGDLVCEHVVSATGNFARQTGGLVGINVPVIPVQHQYIVTEAHPEIVARKAKGLPEMGVLRESDSSWYMREEAGLTKKARRPATSTGRPRTANTSSFRRTSIVSRRISKPRSRAFPLSAKLASRRSTTAPSPIRLTARRLSARRQG